MSICTLADSPGPDLILADCEKALQTQQFIWNSDDFIQANFGNTGDPGIPGDANGDGLVSAGDYASVQVNFGDSASSISVPEPATLGLFGIGLIALIQRQK